jgi:hypothetical protein
MTIHWKALEEYFLMEPLVFRFNHFWWENAFSEFSRGIFLKNLSSPYRMNKLRADWAFNKPYKG